MIGVLNTIHPTKGYSIDIRYTKVDGRVRITSITSHGKDVWCQMTSEMIQGFKAQILAK